MAKPGDKLVVTRSAPAPCLPPTCVTRRGPWIASALDHMVMSNRLGAQCLVEHGSRAAPTSPVSDCWAIWLKWCASEVDVVLDLNSVPLMDGSEDTAKAGILSSLQPQNVRLRRAVANPEEAGKDRYLIYDPQTAGGLLASVPAENADARVAGLIELGYARTMIVGEVLEQSERLEPITVWLRRQLSSPALAEAPRIRSGIPVRDTRFAAHSHHRAGQPRQFQSFRSWCIDVVISAGTLSAKSRRLSPKSAGRSTPRAGRRR